jgi:hypothetical protein
LSALMDKLGAGQMPTPAGADDKAVNRSGGHHQQHDPAGTPQARHHQGQP